MKAVRLESKRLIFEPLSLEHLSRDYVDWLNDSEVHKYLESRGGYNLSMLKDFLSEQEQKQILFWAILERTTKKHIGNIKIDPIDEEKNSGEYGILIGDKSFWGKGYAREASESIINYCFDVLNLAKITLGVISKNEKAIGLYKSLGFNITSTVANYGVYEGESCDSIRMEKLNDT